MINSRWNDIYVHLLSSEIDVYPPATKLGECKTPYVVIKDDGSSNYNNLSSDVCYYSVLCYVPKMDYVELEPFVQQIKGLMKGLEPMLMPANSETPSFYDDSFKAHMKSVMYRNYKKN